MTSDERFNPFFNNFETGTTAPYAGYQEDPEALRVLASSPVKKLRKNDMFTMRAECTLAEAAKIIDELLASGLYRDTRFIRGNSAELRKAGSKSRKLDLDGQHTTSNGESEDLSTNSVQSHSTSSDPGTDMEITQHDEEEPPLEHGEAILAFDHKKKGSAGSSYYHCKYEGSPKTRENRQRKRTSQRSRCKANLTIRFSMGYKPLPDGSLNVRDHGNDPVVITWNKKHTHEVTPQTDATMKKR